MPDDGQRVPAPTQIVSDLGQLTAFGDPVQSKILRILQLQEATSAELGVLIDVPEPEVAEHLQRLVELVLVRVVGTTASNGETEDVYRASARMFNLRPEPRDLETIMSPVAGAMLDTISREILASVTAWPDQKVIYEGRRARLPASRLVEFNDRLVELLREFWGDETQPREEDPNDPLMSFIGVWYRLPE